MTFFRRVDHAAERSKAAAHQDERALRDHSERSTAIDGGKGRVRHPCDRIRRERGFGGTELPDGCADWFDLFQVESHQPFLAGRRETGAHEGGGGSMCAFDAEAEVFPEECLDAFHRAVRGGHGTGECLAGAPEGSCSGAIPAVAGG